MNKRKIFYWFLWSIGLIVLTLVTWTYRESIADASVCFFIFILFTSFHQAAKDIRWLFVILFGAFFGLALFCAQERSMLYKLSFIDEMLDNGIEVIAVGIAMSAVTKMLQTYLR